jgi:hypothetical protein
MPRTGQPANAKMPPAPDPEQMAADALITSITAGISFVAATVVLGIFGGIGISLATAIGGGREVQMVCVGVGLAVGLLVIRFLLRANKEAIKRKNPLWYRGAWIGTLMSLAIICLMYYFPEIIIPAYCPPGAPCEVTG